MRAAPGTVKLEYRNVGRFVAKHFRQQRRVLGPLQYGVEPDETTGRQAACQGLTQTGAVFDDQPPCEARGPPAFRPTSRRRQEISRNFCSGFGQTLSAVDDFPSVHN